MAIAAAPPAHAQPAPVQPAPPSADAVRYAYDGAPLRRVVADAERRGGLRLLARDAVLDRCTVTLRATGRDAFLAALTAALAPQGVRVDVRGEGQVLLVDIRAAPDPGAMDVARRLRVRGQVRDAVTGAGVPYASVTWSEDGAVKGVAAGADGQFEASLPGAGTSSGVRVAVASVGYRTAARVVAARVVAGDAAGAGERLDVALAPVPVRGAETVVVGWRMDSSLDTALAAVAARRSAPGTAEPSVRRALEAFPSVGVGPAFAEGPRVRGLRADGFEVLLDGVPVYNPTHLFGLYDAFNPDALEPVAFYYDAAPARFSGPPAGTLAFATRRGSRDAWDASAAAGSIAARGTAGGPLGREGGPAGLTVLAAARTSVVGRMPFPGSTALLRTGLDAGRETSEVPGGRIAGTIERPTRADAAFSDGHLRLDVGAFGGDLALSLYSGTDDARSAAERVLPTSRVDPRPRVIEAETASRWGSSVGSLAFQRATGPWIARLNVGASRYHARFGKDDFAYLLPGPRPSSLTTAFDTLGYRNDLLDLRVGASAERFSRAQAGVTRWSAGLLAVRYATRYEEQAARAPRAVSDDATLQVDAYADAHAVLGALSLDGGLRLHRFGDHGVAATPRLRASVEAGPVSVFGAVHRGVQFLHRLYFDGQPGASVWVTTDDDEGPTRSEGASAGVAWRISRRAVAQVEAYGRRYENLRQHATSAVVIRRGVGSVVAAPWASDVAGRGRGVEALVRGALPGVFGASLDATAAYTLARMDLRGTGGFLRAPDDRTHQARLGLTAALPGGLGLDLAWATASGVPDPLDASTSPGSLGPYHRLDAAVRLARRVRGSEVRATLSAYNLLGRQNPWYREAVPVVQGGRPQQVALVPVDVYDLGLTPSFEIAVRW